MILLAAVADAAAPHGVRLVDPQGNPFACATLTSINSVVYTTDATGVAAIYEPGLMGRDLWLTPSGDALEPPVDGFGIAGFAVALEEGEVTTVPMQRVGPEPACALGDYEARLLGRDVPTAAEHHEIQVVDAETGRPVPIAAVGALGRESWTDNGGRVAWFHLDAMGAEVTFDVRSDGFAPAAATVIPAPGGRTEIALEREMRAERLVRLTGAGAWRESWLLGHAVPLADPLLDTAVFGQDTSYAVPWDGALFQLWGDTQKPSYPLGNFSATGAVSPLDATPEDGWDIGYFPGDDGFVAPITDPVPGAATWLSGLVEVEGDLYATALVLDAAWNVYGEGSLRWSPEAEIFETILPWPEDQQPHPSGPTVVAGDHVVYHDLVRVPATAAAMVDPSTWEAWTAFVPDGEGFALARLPDGTPDYQWRAGSPAPSWDWASPWYLTGPDHPWWSHDPLTGEEALSHGGAVAWSPWLGRWVHVFSQQGGTSFLGEAWLALGDTPVGPWTWAREIVSHDDYTFYNPYVHPWYFDRDRILFEGTFTAWLTERAPTPRHDYNQILYALNVEDPRNAVAVPFYLVDGVPRAARDVDVDLPVAFAAFATEAEGAIPVGWDTCGGTGALVSDPPGEVLFWALPPGGDGIDVPGFPGVATVFPPRNNVVVPRGQYPLPDRADAGADRCAVVGAVTLDGSGSVLAGGIDSWTWTWDGGSATGERPTVELPLGDTVVELVVAGPSGEARDAVWVSVVASDEVVPPGTDGDPDGTPVAAEGGCGCAAGPGGSPWLAVLALAFAGRRPVRQRAAETV